MTSSTEIIRVGAAGAYVLLIVAFGCSGYFMINSIVQANESFERVGEIINDVEPYEYKRVPASNGGPSVLVPKQTGAVGGCYVGGCSGQICSGRKDVVSTCEWKEAYACYTTAVCEYQDNGLCGWTLDAELDACLSAAK